MDNMINTPHNSVDNKNIADKESMHYKKAVNSTRKKVKLIRHLIIFLIINTVLAIINNVTTTQNQWWLWVALIWGIILIIHLIRVMFSNLGDKLLQQEMTKLAIKNGEQTLQQLSLFDESSVKMEQKEGKLKITFMTKCQKKKNNY